MPVGSQAAVEASVRPATDSRHDNGSGAVLLEANFGLSVLASSQMFEPA